MTETTVPPADARGEPIQRAAADLVAGDRIAAGFLPPLYKPAVVEHVARYQLSAYREAWALVSYREDDGRADASHFLGEKLIPLEARADDGMGYSREADDPTPVSPARVPLHTGGMTDGGLVDETGCTHGVTTCRCADADTVPVPAEDATVTRLPEAVPTEDAGGDCPPGGCRPNFCVGADDCRRDEDADSEEQERGIDPDSSMEAHYDAEAEGILLPARRQELLWKRAVGWAGSLKGALFNAHAQALVEDNDRAKALVERSMTSRDAGRIPNPDLARFMAVREGRRRSETASAE